jgi:hypothetical protein
MSKISQNPTILAQGTPQDKSTTESIPERRQIMRYPFTATADVMDLHTRARVTGRNSDLGTGGCFIDLISPFGEGTLVLVRLEREKKVFQAVARVCYAQPTLGMGLAFTEIKSEDRIVLESWLAELDGSILPETHEALAPPDSSSISDVLRVQQVLNELINLMVRRKMISAEEGAALLRRIFE